MLKGVAFSSDAKAKTPKTDFGYLPYLL